MASPEGPLGNPSVRARVGDAKHAAVSRGVLHFRGDPGVQRFLARLEEQRRRAALAECLAPLVISTLGRCDQPVVQSHSIQDGVVRQVAEDGHVVMFKRTNEGAARLGLVGHRKATTFSGFCAQHDASIFREIDFSDERPFEPDNPRHAALLALRAIAREYWTKTNAIRLLTRIERLAVQGDLEEIKRALGLGDYNINFLHEIGRDLLRGFSRTSGWAQGRMRSWLASLATQLKNGKYHQTRTVVLRLPMLPSLAVASAFGPVRDLRGQLLNTHTSPSNVAEVVLSVIPAHGHHDIVLSYHRRFPRLTGLMHQLQALAPADLVLAVSYLALVYCENVILAPRTLRSFSSEQIALIEEIFDRTVVDQDVALEDMPRISLFGALAV